MADQVRKTVATRGDANRKLAKMRAATNRDAIPCGAMR